MNIDFKKQIDIFINLVQTFDISVLERADYIFNPWANADETDIFDAVNIRCDNLKNYLYSKENANYILIAESPSKGARYTGIAMTSEKVIKDYQLGYNYTSLNNNKYKKGELTATKVWNEISKSKNKFVLWNAFAFNIHSKQNQWFMTPTKNELIANKYILQNFLNIFPNAQIIALGDTAKTALKILDIQNVICVRHPSNDYKKEFPVQISKYL